MLTGKSCSLLQFLLDQNKTISKPAHRAQAHFDLRVQEKSGGTLYLEISQSETTIEMFELLRKFSCNHSSASSTTDFFFFFPSSVSFFTNITKHKMKLITQTGIMKTSFHRKCLLCSKKKRKEKKKNYRPKKKMKTQACNLCPNRKSYCTSKSSKEKRVYINIYRWR